MFSSAPRSTSWPDAAAGGAAGPRCAGAAPQLAEEPEVPAGVAPASEEGLPARRAEPGTLGAESAATASPAAALGRCNETMVAVRDLGKCYEIYPRPLDRLKQTLYRGRRQFYREFWALRDVSLEVRRGEALGVIGRNGSGKSTLLQIIAGTLRPTTGQVATRGRVHALLELGSGFNPEFTGRENVFLNGTILGLSRQQIAARFDEIAAFADIGDFLDQPVKIYSTGMFMRLAFAVQVVLDPDLLIVDEALAVGDAGFQIKCYSRMRELLDRGVAVILVTHDTQTVRSFCTRAIWLHDGMLRAAGGPLDVTSQYVQFLSQSYSAARLISPSSRGSLPGAHEGAGLTLAPPASDSERLTSLAGRSDLVRWGSGELRITAVGLDNGRRPREAVFEHGERLHVTLVAEVLKDIHSTDIGFGFAFRNLRGLDVITSTTYDEGRRLPALRAGQHVRVAFELDNILAPGAYALVVCAEDRTSPQYHYYDFVENAAQFRVLARKNIHSLVLPTVNQSVLVY